MYWDEKSTSASTDHVDKNKTDKMAVDENKIKTDHNALLGFERFKVRKISSILPNFETYVLSSTIASHVSEDT